MMTRPREPWGGSVRSGWPWTRCVLVRGEWREVFVGRSPSWLMSSIRGGHKAGTAIEVGAPSAIANASSFSRLCGVSRNGEVVTCTTAPVQRCWRSLRHPRDQHSIFSPRKHDLKRKIASGAHQTNQVMRFLQVTQSDLQTPDRASVVVEQAGLSVRDSLADGGEFDGTSD